MAEYVAPHDKIYKLQLKYNINLREKVNQNIKAAMKLNENSFKYLIQEQAEDLDEVHKKCTENDGLPVTPSNTSKYKESANGSSILDVLVQRDKIHDEEYNGYGSDITSETSESPDPQEICKSTSIADNNAVTTSEKKDVNKSSSKTDTSFASFHETTKFYNASNIEEFINTQTESNRSADTLSKNLSDMFQSLKTKGDNNSKLIPAGANMGSYLRAISKSINNDKKSDLIN